MKPYPEVESLIKKVVSVIKAKPVLNDYVGILKPYRSTAEIFEDAAGNHAFDDSPFLFEITEDEGHTIRAFFQHYSCRRDEELKAAVEKLIEEA